MRFRRKDIGGQARSKYFSYLNNSSYNSGTTTGGSNNFTFEEKWLPAKLNADGSYTVDLARVNFTGLIVGQSDIIAYAASDYDGEDSGAAFLKALNITSPKNDDILVYKDGQWINKEADFGSTELDLEQLSSYLTENNFITSDYVDNKFVTLDTWQVITGAKTFESTDILDSVNAVSGSDNAWTEHYSLRLRASNNAMTFLVDGQFNYRQALIQVGHASKGYAANLGTLHLNKFGGNVTINGQTAWHAGNDGHGSGLDADLLDGLHNGEVTALNVNYCSNENKPSSVQFMQKASGWNNWDAPAQNWFSVIKMNHGNGDTYYNRTLAFDFFSHRIYTGRMEGGNFGGWKTLAFTDDNVASASELQTAHTIWGQSYKGNNDVSGNMSGVGKINFSAGTEITTDATHYYFGTAGQSSAAFVGVGSLLVSHSWSDNTKVPTNGIYCRGELQSVGSMFYHGNDGTLKIYSIANPTQPAAYGTETVAIQTSFDSQDPQTGTYPTLYQDRVVLALQPRGGRVGISQAAPRYKLDVNGDIIADGWIRTTNARGWYNETYGGGIYMDNSVWVKTFQKPLNISFSNAIGANGFNVGLSIAKDNHSALEVSSGSYTMGLGCHSNGHWYWWRGTSDPWSPTGKSYVMEYDGGTWNFTGNILASGDVICYSDARLKSDIQTLNNRGYLTPRTYIKDGKKNIGFIAQEVKEKYPELIQEGEYLSLNYNGLVAVLEAQILELKEEINKLREEVINYVGQ